MDIFTCIIAMKKTLNSQKAEWFFHTCQLTLYRNGKTLKSVTEALIMNALSRKWRNVCSML